MATKTCHVCGDERPVEEFRLRSRDGEDRHNNCRACYTEYMREYNRRQRHKERVRSRFYVVLHGQLDLSMRLY